MAVVHSEAEAYEWDKSSDVCIISPCNMASHGLSAMLKSSGGRESIEVIVPTGFHHEDGVYQMRSILPDRYVLVFIPCEPVSALFMLKLLANLLSLNIPFSRLLILSHFSTLWLYRTLKRLSGRNVMPHSMFSARANLPCFLLDKLINVQYPALSMAQIAFEEEKESRTRCEALTGRELDAVLEYLSGNKIRNPSTRSFKTLYAQRQSGLSKLITQLPTSAEYLPLKLRQSLSKINPPCLTTSPREEKNFCRAVRNGKVFPVFQPVVDRTMRVQGFEVLIRWRCDNHVLMPADFLPLIRSRHAWIQLTEFVINVAVQHINQFDGQLYFAVNVPACVAESREILRMAEKARSSLREPAWCECLVLEFNETVAPNKNPEVMDTVCEMLAAGYRIFLDDCFSQSSVMFPVRLAQFSGYKVDMSLIDTFMKNQHDENLIRALIYYCKLTGSHCIAEGVDSSEKFNALADMGVMGFQGFYISPPVPAGELERVVRGK